jgi:hypothetical protein
MKTHKYVAALTLMIAACLAGSACNQKGKNEPPKTTDPMAGEGRRPDAHPDGWLFHQKDEKFHIRLKIDTGKKEATVKILDDKAKNEVPITADAIKLDLVDAKPPKQIDLKAQRKGKGSSTSLFVGTDDALAGKIDPAKLEIQATIDGTPYVFELDTEHEPKAKK